MKTRPDRIKALSGALASLLEQEGLACRDMISSLIEAIRSPQGTESQRALHLTGVLKKLQDRLDLLTKMACDDFLEKIASEAEESGDSLADSRAATVFASLVKVQPPTVQAVCESLLDRLIEVIEAERGFILFYFPESTEASIHVARNYMTRNLSVEEYGFSRSLLKNVFEGGKPLLLEDASGDAKFSKEVSVIQLALKSVLAAPMIQNGRVVGALYLENNKLVSAFDERDLCLVEDVARFAVFYLDNARLLPVAFEPDARIFLDESKASKEIIGRDPNILALLDVVGRIADSPAAVLIEGETGTGKELVARALHFQSSRRDRPFVALNCAAIPEHLLESELFGYEKGAFTGAVGRYIGHIERCDGGTLFLDEINEMVGPLQSKLLRFLQSQEFYRLSSTEMVRVDVRIVAATSKNLKAIIQEGKFQEALYYRLNVIPIRIPALRERRGDIQLLIEHFLDKFSAVYGKRVFLEQEAREHLSHYDYPGNVRELENLIHRLVVLASDDSIRAGDLPDEVRQETSERFSLEKDPLYRVLHTPPVDLEDLRRRKEEVQRVLDEQTYQLVLKAVEEADGNLTLAAARLGMHRVTLYNWLKRSKQADGQSQP
ncbi:MAG: sigma-54-dependent Fis family transcriptional regulator [Blastocatellia bacterium]|nr:sigma-54-dependent Fis family transcriptional regulator [Blastocatellia bacterium]